MRLVGVAWVSGTDFGTISLDAVPARGSSVMCTGARCNLCCRRMCFFWGWRAPAPLPGLSGGGLSPWRTSVRYPWCSGPIPGMEKVPRQEWLHKARISSTALCMSGHSMTLLWKHFVHEALFVSWEVVLKTMPAEPTATPLYLKWYHLLLFVCVLPPSRGWAVRMDAWSLVFPAVPLALGIAPGVDGALSKYWLDGWVDVRGVKVWRSSHWQQEEGLCGWQPRADLGAEQSWAAGPLPHWVPAKALLPKLIFIIWFPSLHASISDCRSIMSHKNWVLPGNSGTFLGHVRLTLQKYESILQQLDRLMPQERFYPKKRTDRMV